MFSGIVEALGEIKSIKEEGSNITYTVASPISKETYIDQSISHNGVCLTVTRLDEESHDVVAVKETLDKSNLKHIKPGDHINLERSITLETRLDGHMVQGHVDTIIRCVGKEELEGSWYFEFEYDQEYDTLLVDKGSVCINGVSLTLIDPKDGKFKATIIPYTYEHTSFGQLEAGDFANVEFDIIGKYIQKYFDKYRK